MPTKAKAEPIKLRIIGKFLINGFKNSGSIIPKLVGNKKIELFQAKVPQPTLRSLVIKPQKIEKRVKQNIEIDIIKELSCDTKKDLKLLLLRKKANKSKRIEYNAVKKAALIPKR